LAEKGLTKTLQDVVDKIKVQLFLFIIAIAIIIALVATYANIIIAVLITVLGYGGLIAYVYLQTIKAQSLSRKEPKQIELPDHTQLCYYNENDKDPSSENRQTIEAKLAAEATKSQTIKILINTGQPIFAAKTSFLYNPIISKAADNVKVLLLNPKATPIMEQRAREAGYVLDDYKNEIVKSIEFCKRQKIDCRLFNFLSPWRLFIFDDERVYVQLYLANRSGDTSPIYGYKAEGFDLGASFLRYFDAIYSTSQSA
jgi:hypothetical protein